MLLLMGGSDPAPPPVQKEYVPPAVKGEELLTEETSAAALPDTGVRRRPAQFSSSYGTPDQVTDITTTVAKSLLGE